MGMSDVEEWGDEPEAVPVRLEAEQRELKAAGWKPKERKGETVWRNPESGLWYPQGVAISLLREGVDLEDFPRREPEGDTRHAREDALPEKGTDRRPYDNSGIL